VEETGHVELGHAEVGGVDVAFRRAGSGPPLVLVHGAALDSRSWGPQLAGLCDELTVVAWDEPGVGRSSPVPEGFGLADFAGALAGFVERLGLGPVHLAGLSWGGTVVLECYRRHPGLVASLVLMDTYAGWKGSLPADEVRRRVDGVRESLEGPPGEFDPTLPGLFASEPSADVVALMAEMAADVRPETLALELGIMAEADLGDVLPTIAVPTLLVWGRDDARSPVDLVARRFADDIPGSELAVIEGAGHMSNLEQPDRVNDVIRDFVRRHRTA